MIDVITLDNGVRIALEPMHSVRTIALGIFIKTGSRNEKEIENGLSHFIEHMLFKGTEKRTAKDIADTMDQIGGQMNAFTSKEFTCYYVRVLDSHIDIALDVLSDMFFHSTFLSEEIEKEIQVVTEEIAMYEDSPDDLIHDVLQGGVWEGHSLANPILGTVETLDGFSHETVKEFFKKQYATDNTVIALAGNFNQADMIEKINEKFSSFNHSTEKREIKEVMYQPISEKRYKDIEQLHIAMAFPGFSLGSHEGYTMAILNLIFGGSMSSRLFQRVREERGLVYTIYSHHSSYTDVGLFNIYAALNPKNAVEAMGLIVDEIISLGSNPITEKQLILAKEQMKSNLVMGLESTSNRMTSIGRHLLLQDRIYAPDEQIERIEKVSLEDMEMARKSQLALDGLSLCTVGDWDGDQDSLIKEWRQRS